MTYLEMNNITIVLPDSIKHCEEQMVALTDALCEILNLRNLHLSFNFYYEEKDSNTATCSDSLVENAYTLGFNLAYLKPNEFPQAFIHELTHVKQLQSGRLRREDDGDIWEDRQFFDKHILASDEFYHSLPWEVEAVNMEAFGEMFRLRIKMEEVFNENIGKLVPLFNLY